MRSHALLAISYVRVALIVFFVAVLPGGLYLKATATGDAKRAHQASIDGCERTNVLRRTVDQLLTTARLRAASQHQYQFSQEYFDQRSALRAVKFALPGGAEVDCVAANR